MRRANVPVLVVSGLDANIYRGVMNALDAWDYLQWPVQEHAYISTVLSILRLATEAKKRGQQSGSELVTDPLKLPTPLWKGKRLGIPAAQQRLLHTIYEQRNAPDPTVPYVKLYEVLQVGKNKENVKQQVARINAAFREIEPDMPRRIRAEPMRGYYWVDR
jgi:DNA-binding response OmpR family regulator